MSRVGVRRLGFKFPFLHFTYPPHREWGSGSGIPLCEQLTYLGNVIRVNRTNLIAHSSNNMVSRVMGQLSCVSPLHCSLPLQPHQFQVARAALCQQLQHPLPQFPFEEWQIDSTHCAIKLIDTSGSESYRNQKFQEFRATFWWPCWG